jgi:hypothetical protein
MAMRSLPHWYAQPRGTAITSLAVLEASDEDEGGFLPRLANRLTNLVDGGPAGVVGFLVVLSILATLPAAGASTPWLVATLSLIPIAFCAVAGGAGLLVYREGEGAPPWASGLVSFLIITGKVAVVFFVVVTVVTVVVMALAMIAGISSAGRGR